MEAKKEKNIIKFNNKRNLRSLFFSAAKNNTKIYRREIPSLRSFPAGCCVCLKSHSVTKLQSVIKRAQKKNLERDPGWDTREKKAATKGGKRGRRAPAKNLSSEYYCRHYRFDRELRVGERS